MMNCSHRLTAALRPRAAMGLSTIASRGFAATSARSALKKLTGKRDKRSLEQRASADADALADTAALLDIRDVKPIRIVLPTLNVNDVDENVVGKVFLIPEALASSLSNYGHLNGKMVEQLVGHNYTCVRRETMSLLHRIKTPDSNNNVAIVDGAAGTGKSHLLVQAQVLGSQLGRAVLALPCGNTITNSSWAYAATDGAVWSQDDLCADMLRRWSEANGKLFSHTKTIKDMALPGGAKVAAGAPISQLVSAAELNSAAAPAARDAVLAALAASKVGIVFTIDHIDGLAADSLYKDRSCRPIHPEQLEMGRFALGLLNGTLQQPGSVIVAARVSSGRKRVPLDTALGQRTRQAYETYDERCELVLPERYRAKYPTLRDRRRAHVANTSSEQSPLFSRGDSPVLHLGSFTFKEGSALLNTFWRAQLMRDATTEQDADQTPSDSLIRRHITMAGLNAKELERSCLQLV